MTAVDYGFEPVEAFTVTVGCSNPLHPLRVDVTITDAGQEVYCSRCGSRMWRPVERLTRLFSEVCCHLRVDGTTMYGADVGDGMVQLYGLDGKPVSFPITKGEAGWPREATP